jgi:hypothetical protein
LAFVFVVVITVEDLLLFVAITTFFFKNNPEIACQAPKPLENQPTPT